MYKQIAESLIDIGNSNVFFILIVSIIIDVMLGKYRAYKEQEINSYTGVSGLIKHSLVIFIQIGVGIVSRLVNYQSFSVFLCVFFISDYLVSIYANASIVGIPLPDVELIKKEIQKKEERNGSNYDL